MTASNLAESAKELLTPTAAYADLLNRAGRRKQQLEVQTVVKCLPDSIWVMNASNSRSASVAGCPSRTR